MQGIDQDRIYVYCVPETRGSQNDPDKGFLRPIFVDTVNGLVVANPEIFERNGSIRVTTGFQKFSSPNNYRFFKVEATVSNAWDPNNTHNGISKYVTFDRVAQQAGLLDVATLITSDYPDPSKSGSFVCAAESAPTDFVFLKCTGINERKYIIGPLDVVRDSVKQIEDRTYSFRVKPVDRPMGSVFNRMSKAPHSALVFDYDLIPSGVILYSEILRNEYIVNASNLPDSSAELIDLSTDEHLIKWASKRLKGLNPGTVEIAQKFKGLIDKLPNEASLPDNIYHERIKRLGSIAGRLGEAEGFPQILSEYLKTDEGQSAIESFARANSTSLIENYLEEEYTKIDSELEKAKEKNYKDKQALEYDIQKLRQEKNQLEQENQDLAEKNHNLEITEVKKELEELKKEKELVEDVSSLMTMKRILEADIERLNERRIESDKTLQSLRHQINQSTEKHKSDLLKLRMDLDVIAGNTRNDKSLQADIKEIRQFYKVSGLDDNKESVRSRIIDEITDSLLSRNRQINNNDVAVFLTCLVQSLIVTLAGKPGSGKTSFVREFSEAIGLRKQKKYVHIQVQRGWSSDRDLIGFYNKLNHSYEPDRYGFYALLNGLQQLSPDNQFSIALLDEANLSPIEHYWSNFMGATDDLSSCSIPGADQESNLLLPEGFRFVATVNYDRTTEPLSPRFLDRSPIITIENPSSGLLFSTINDLESSSTIQDLPFSYTDLVAYFGKSTNNELHDDEKSVLNEILENHRFINVEFRKINAIRSFTDTLRTFFKKNAPGELLALDYAILVYLLPLINGTGREYKNNLISFNEFLTGRGLYKSAEKTKQIISLSQFDSYTFFS